MLERAGRAVRARGARHPQRRPRRDLVGRAGTPARCGCSTPHDPTSPPRSVGGRRAGVEYHAEHVVLPDGTDALLLVTNDGARSSGWPAARCPATPTRTTRAWQPVRAEDPAERLERVDAFADHVVLSFRVRRPAPAAGAAASTRWTRAGHRRRPASSTAARVDARPHNEDFTATAVTVVDESYVQPPVWSDVDLATGARTERHRQDAPGHDPERYVGETRTFPAPDGTAGPRDGRTAPGHAAGRHARPPCCTATAPTSPPTTRTGTRRCPACSTAGVVFVHAHVRGGGEGGRRWWLDGRLEHKQHTFTDHIAVADGLAATGWSTAAGIAHPRAQRRRAAPGRGAHPAPGPLAGRGRRGAVRRRGHHDARPVHPAHRQRVGRVGRPAAQGGLRLDARLLAVRQPPAGRRAARPAGHRRAARRRG